MPAAGTPEAELGLGDKPCPICQDRFKSEWSDEEEEWVWWNAVVVDKVVRFSLSLSFALSQRLSRLVSALSAHTPLARLTALPRDLPRRGGPVALERRRRFFCFRRCVPRLGPHLSRVDAECFGRQFKETQSRQRRSRRPCRERGHSIDDDDVFAAQAQSRG